MLGEDPAHADEDWRARTGVVLQSWRDHPRWTPRGCSTSSAATTRRTPRPSAPRPVRRRRAARDGRPDELADRKIVTLSGGQRRRLDVAIGIVGRPELLFLDEPTAGFDPQARREFHHLVHRLSDLEDTTILLTTHDLDEAEKLADRVLILAGGRIVADDSAEGLARRVAGEAEVRWSRDGERFVHATEDADRVRPRAVRPVRRRRHRPRGPPRQPRGHLPDAGPAARVRPARRGRRAFAEVTR